MNNSLHGAYKRLPHWLRRQLPQTADMLKTRNVVEKFSLNTVCKSGRCPNIWECFSRSMLTFMILGTVCTRKCCFCGVISGDPDTVDHEEPAKIVRAIGELGLSHVVITSVTRDDLPDRGAGHFYNVIQEIRKCLPLVTIEVLTPDFGGAMSLVDRVLEAHPAIYGHNIETVPRLYPILRPEADFQRSLGVMHYVKKNSDMYIKSGIMMGLGEQSEEVLVTLKQLRDAGCHMVTIGQYLSPSKKHYPVDTYVEPEIFGYYEEEAKKLGFDFVLSGPLVRSSYLSNRVFEEMN